jgi:cyclase
MEGLRVLGKPETFALHYYEQGIDELIYQDIVASLYQRNSLLEHITRIAEKIFIPLTVGGGLRTREDIQKVLRAGADKVSINTAAINSPDFINRSSEMFGSSTIVAAIECIRQADGSYLAYTDNGRERTGIEVLSWAAELENRGAGEILLTSIDKEGTGSGFNIELVKMVSSRVRIPVIAHGGASTNEHIAQVIKEGLSDAVAASSMFHYGLINNSMEVDYHKEEGNVSYLQRHQRNQVFEGVDVSSLKTYLGQQGIAVRE